MLTQLLVGRRPAANLRFLRRTGLLAYVLPEVAALIDFHRSSRHHHKDVWAHTYQVVQQAIPKPKIRWAALLHDIGKVHTRSFSGKRKVHFFRHEDVGAYMFEGIAQRLVFPTQLAARVRVLIQHHLRPAVYESNWTDAAVRRFTTDMDGFLEDSLHLARADVTSRIPGRRREAISSLFELRNRIEGVRVDDLRRRPCVPKGLGSHIIRELGIEPGPEVGHLRDLCEQAVRCGDLSIDPDIASCIQFLRQHMAA
jgi:poly(A) polymerase